MRARGNPGCGRALPECALATSRGAFLSPRVHAGAAIGVQGAVHALVVHAGEEPPACRCIVTAPSTGSLESQSLRWREYGEEMFPLLSLADQPARLHRRLQKLMLSVMFRIAIIMPSNRFTFLVAALMFAASVGAMVARPTAKLADEGPAISLESMIPKQFADWREQPKLFAQVVNPQTKELLDKLYRQILARTFSVTRERFGPFD
jgi:hypothetical protein